MEKLNIANIGLFRVGNFVTYKGYEANFESDFNLSSVRGNRLDYIMIEDIGFRDGSLRLNGVLYQVLLSPGRLQTFQLFKNGRCKATIKYMHELQNAFLAVSGFELIDVTCNYYNRLHWDTMKANDLCLGGKQNDIRD